MQPIPLVVIGASAGGLDALATLLSKVSPEIPAAILAVIHIGAHNSRLPSFFQRSSALPAAYADDDMKIAPGTITFAPPDRHLIVEDGRLRLGRGPRENHSRPAIDPLFRSAAEVYGPLVTGVILTGYLTDGTAGLWEVKRRGGIAIAQDPEEAEVPSMPSSAREHVALDYCLPLKAIGPLLNRLAAEAMEKAPPLPSHSGGPEMDYTTDQPAALTCPDCGGALRKNALGSYAQFRCHIGHTFGRPEMAKLQFELLGATLESSIRMLNERKSLCLDAATEARLRKREVEARMWEEAAQESAERFGALAEFFEDAWKRPELILAAEGAKPPQDAPRSKSKRV